MEVHVWIAITVKQVVWYCHQDQVFVLHVEMRMSIGMGKGRLESRKGANECKLNE